MTAVGGGPALRVRGLSKRFGAVQAVGGVDLDVAPGTFLGLVGPNGAGKTTTMSIVTGLLRPDAGSVEVDGVDVWRDPRGAKARMGVLPDALRTFERLTGRELLHFSGQLRELPLDLVRRRADELLHVLDLGGAAGNLVVDYSAGMRKKIGLAAALLHNPRLLLLDEPFESVDPVSARTIRDVLTRYTATGATVVLSSHAMHLVEQVCDSVAVMHHGRLVTVGALEQVRAGRSLEDAFLALVGADVPGRGSLSWLGSSPA